MGYVFTDVGAPTPTLLAACSLPHLAGVGHKGAVGELSNQLQCIPILAIKRHSVALGCVFSPCYCYYCGQHQVALVH